MARSRFAEEPSETYAPQQDRSRRASTNSKRYRGRSSAQNTQESQQSQKQRQPRIPGGKRRILRSAVPDTGATRKFWAYAASTFILWTVVPFYVTQVLFWMLGLAGIGLETVPFAGEWFLPGVEIYMVSYLVIVIIGICSMVYAAVVYFTRRVDAFSGVKTLVFMLCVTGYFVFFLNAFPWVIGWILCVIYTQNKEGEEKA